jgi:hypothetical protein
MKLGKKQKPSNKSDSLSLFFVIYENDTFRAPINKEIFPAKFTLMFFLYLLILLKLILPLAKLLPSTVIQLLS